MLRPLIVRLLTELHTEDALAGLLASSADVLDGSPPRPEDARDRAGAERDLARALDAMLSRDDPVATTPEQVARIRQFVRRLERRAADPADRERARRIERALHPWPNPQAAARMRAAAAALVERIAVAPDLDLPALLGQLDRAAEAVDYEFDEDVAARALHAAAWAVTDPDRRAALLAHALGRARRCASSATSGGEGLSRLVQVQKLEADLDAAMLPVPSTVSSYDVPVLYTRRGPRRFAHFVLRSLGARSIHAVGWPRTIMHDFDVAAGAFRWSVYWSAGTGVASDTQFHAGGCSFRLSLGPASDELVVHDDGPVPPDQPPNRGW